MKTSVTILIFICMTIGSMKAGGILTNYNQSASYVRMYARDASTDVDAVFYNPAGLTLLGKGFFFSITNQSIFQNRTVKSNYSFLHGAPEASYEGKINAFVFPNIYAAYNVGKFSFSLGINPVGGGGSATFDKGLPSFEAGIADIVPKLKTQLLPLDNAINASTGSNPGFSNISDYRQSTKLDATSLFWGTQFNVAYRACEFISVAAGVRYVMAKNTYKGHINDIEILAPATYGGWQTPGSYFRTLAVNPYVIGAGQVALMTGTATALDAQTANKEVDVEQTASGFTPIVSVDLIPNENLNIAVKYEFATKLELENKTKVDGTGSFPDKAKSRSDMPALLSVGGQYKITPKLNAQVGFHYFFDKSANYGRKDTTGAFVSNSSVINHNLYEVAVGAEYKITDKMLVSIGYLMSKTGVSKNFQTDLSYSLSSNTIGLGGAYNISPSIKLNVGASYTLYDKSSKDYHHLLGTSYLPVQDTYYKNTFIFAIGADFKFAK
jgi:long-chain fatty acid transport protein